MLKVYDFTGSGNGYKTWLLLSQLGLPFQRIERDILKGETRTPEFLKRVASAVIRIREFRVELQGAVIALKSLTLSPQRSQHISLVVMRLHQSRIERGDPVRRRVDLCFRRPGTDARRPLPHHRRPLARRLSQVHCSSTGDSQRRLGRH